MQRASSQPRSRPNAEPPTDSCALWQPCHVPPEPLLVDSIVHMLAGFSSDQFQCEKRPLVEPLAIDTLDRLSAYPRSPQWSQRRPTRLVDLTLKTSAHLIEQFTNSATILTKLDNLTRLCLRPPLSFGTVLYSLALALSRYLRRTRADLRALLLRRPQMTIVQLSLETSAQKTQLLLLEKFLRECAFDPVISLDPATPRKPPPLDARTALSCSLLDALFDRLDRLEDDRHFRLFFWLFFQSLRPYLKKLEHWLCLGTLGDGDLFITRPPRDRATPSTPHSPEYRVDDRCPKCLAPCVEKILAAGKMSVILRQLQYSSQTTRNNTLNLVDDIYDRILRSFKLHPSSQTPSRLPNSPVTRKNPVKKNTIRPAKPNSSPPCALTARWFSLPEPLSPVEAPCSPISPSDDRAPTNRDLLALDSPPTSTHFLSTDFSLIKPFGVLTSALISSHIAASVTAFYDRTRIQLHHFLASHCALAEHLQAIHAFFCFHQKPLQDVYLLGLFDSLWHSRPVTEQDLNAWLQPALNAHTASKLSLRIRARVSSDPSPTRAPPEENTLCENEPSALKNIFAANRIHFQCDAKWPIQTLLVPPILTRYNQLSTLFTSLQLSRFALERGTPFRMLTKIDTTAEFYPLLHQMHLFRSKLLFFVAHLHSYVADKAFRASTRVFLLPNDASDLDQLVSRHISLVDQLLDQCFSSAQLKALKGQIDRILNLAITFSKTYNDMCCHFLHLDKTSLAPSQPTPDVSRPQPSHLGKPLSRSCDHWATTYQKLSERFHATHMLTLTVLAKLSHHRPTAYGLFDFANELNYSGYYSLYT